MPAGFVPAPDRRMVLAEATFAGAYRQFGLRVMALAEQICPRARNEPNGDESSSPLYKSHFVQASLDPVLGWRIDVGANKSYAYFVHQGTHPHDIYPKNKQALAFFWPKAFFGYAVFAHVRHPGTRPQPWLWSATGTIIRSSLV